MHMQNQPFRTTASTPAGRPLSRARACLTALVLGATLSLAQAETVEGDVRKVDATAGKITLRHDEIKSLNMPPMTMSYRVRNAAWLTTVQVGDRVKFSADKVNGQFTITELDVVR